MTSLAVALVLLSALLHGLWNYVAKRAGGGAAFIWMFAAFETLLYTPIVLYLHFVQHEALEPISLIFIAGSATLHVIYFVLLSRGYKVGDLSIVYPLARATGPLISTFAAILFFAEHPSVAALIGGFLICGGAFWLTGDPRKLREKGAAAGVLYALLTGLSIAAYTLWDTYGVSRLMLQPLIYQWGLGAFRWLWLTPHAIRHWDQVQEHWRRDKYRAVVVAIFGSASYLLILIALTFSPVSYVAPMRVVSVLVGVVLGTRILREADASRRLLSAAAMVGGVFILSVA